MISYAIICSIYLKMYKENTKVFFRQILMYFNGLQKWNLSKQILFQLTYIQWRKLNKFHVKTFMEFICISDNPRRMCMQDKIPCNILSNELEYTFLSCFWLYLLCNRIFSQAIAYKCNTVDSNDDKLQDKHLHNNTIPHPEHNFVFEHLNRTQFHNDIKISNFNNIYYVLTY